MQNPAVDTCLFQKWTRLNCCRKRQIKNETAEKIFFKQKNIFRYDNDLIQ